MMVMEAMGAPRRSMETALLAPAREDGRPHRGKSRQLLAQKGRVCRWGASPWLRWAEAVARKREGNAPQRPALMAPEHPANALSTPASAGVCVAMAEP